MRLARIAMVLAMTLFTGAAYAQEQRGSIEGIVKDASGAVLPGVTVTATAASGAKLEAVTDAEGVFRFPSVAPAVYTVAANLTGFSPREISNDLRSFWSAAGFGPRSFRRRSWASTSRGI